MNLKLNNISRRKFFHYLLGGLVSIEVLWLLFHSTGKENKKEKKQELYDAGTIDSFDNQHIYPFTNRHFNLIRYKDGGFMALSSKCTHLGCIVNANTNHQGFTCPCHSSAFDLYGNVVSSPATRPLDYYPIIFKDRHLLVDLSKAKKRQKFDQAQVFYLEI